MQRNHVIESDESIFVGCKEESYLKKMQEKAQQLYLYDSDQLTPKVLEQSPYKLHVSLTIDEYVKHGEKIKEIIITHLENGAINDFKLINDKVAQSKMDSAKNSLTLLNEYKNMISRNEKPNQNWQDHFLSVLNSYFGVNLDEIPSEDMIDEAIRRTTRTIVDVQRLLEGDQFTIYIPENFDKNMILNLCNDINIYLARKNASPGKLLDIESTLGNYINLRQEYLMEDFHSVNDSGVMDLDKRINSVKIHDNDIENARRKRIVLEQEESDFYKYINTNLTKLPSLQYTSIFQSSPVEKKEEVPNQQKVLGMQ